MALKTNMFSEEIDGLNISLVIVVPPGLKIYLLHKRSSSLYKKQSLWVTEVFRSLLKTYLRSTISEERLNSMAIM